jgi:hypothetical protein
MYPNITPLRTVLVISLLVLFVIKSINFFETNLLLDAHFICYLLYDYINKK